MSDILATEFQEILLAPTENNALLTRVLSLITNEPIIGKSTQRGTRVALLHDLLTELINGDYTLDQAIANVDLYLPRLNSTCSSDKRTFVNLVKIATNY